MLKLISVLIVFITLCIIYDLTYKKISMVKQVLIMMIAIGVIKHGIKNRENFNTMYLNELKDNDEKMKEFCSELTLLDRYSENTLLLKNFRDKLIDRNNKQIAGLKKDIDNLYLKKINSEVSLKQKYVLDQHNNANKQLKAIETAKQNMINKNKLKINLK